MNLVAAKSKVRFVQPAGYQMNGSRRWPPSTKTWQLSSKKPFGVGVDSCNLFSVTKVDAHKWWSGLDLQCCSDDLKFRGSYLKFEGSCLQFKEIRSVLMCVGHIQTNNSSTFHFRKRNSHWGHKLESATRAQFCATRAQFWKVVVSVRKTSKNWKSLMKSPKNPKIISKSPTISEISENIGQTSEKMSENCARAVQSWS